MIVERSMHPQFLSNTYLVAEAEGGEALFIDAGGPGAGGGGALFTAAGGPMQPLFDAVERLGVTPTVVLLTHHHYDHICELDAIRERWPDVRVLADEREGIEQPEPFVNGSYAGLDVTGLPTPGHTGGMLAF